MTEAIATEELQELVLSFSSKIELHHNLNGNPKSTALPNVNLANRSHYTSRELGQTPPLNTPSSRGNYSNNSRGGNTRGRGCGCFNSRGNYSNNSGGGNTRGRGCGCFNNNNNSILTCQVCRKFGHSVAICYNRYDDTYMGTDPHNNRAQGKPRPSAFVATPKLINNDAWYADNRSSNHVTTNGGNLNQKHEYGGKDKLIVGNGYPLTSTHIRSAQGHKKVLLQGMLRDGLYQFSSIPVKFNQPDSVTKLVVVYSANTIQQSNFLFENDARHQRLGHPSDRVLRLVLNSSNVPV
uniref:Uncharacterized protein n=1 Tax=Cannabis sativa TaxID=3483 RepID=A0A803P3A3_CANSA